MGRAASGKRCNRSESCRRVRNLRLLSKHWHPCAQAEGLRSAPALHREAYVTAGYTPFLSFEVKELQESVQTLLSLGATLDGAIKHMNEGQVGMHSGRLREPRSIAGALQRRHLGFKDWYTLKSYTLI